MEEFLGRLGVNVDVSFALVYASLIWVRCLSVVAVIPFLFGKPVPRQVRVGGAFVLTVFLYPNLVPPEPLPLPSSHMVLVVLYLKEVFFGLAIGMAASVLFYAFDAAGRIIDSQRGMGIARVLIPALGGQASITGAFLFQLAVVIYLCIGGHRLFFSALFESYIFLPVLEVPTLRDGLLPLMDLFAVVTGKVIYIAVQVAAPVMIAILLSDIIMGIANRIAPQINVWYLSFTIRGYVGTIMLFFAITMIISQIERYTLMGNTYSRDVLNIIRSGGVSPPETPQAGVEGGSSEQDWTR